MSGALNSFLAGTANLLEGSSKVVSRGTLRLFLENIQVFFNGFIQADKKPTDEYKKALNSNVKLFIRQLLHRSSNDVKEVLIDAFGADLSLLDQDSTPDFIIEKLWAAFRKPNAKAAGEIKTLIGTIKLSPTSIEFRGNYQRVMQLFVEHDEVAEEGKKLSCDEKLLVLMRSLGNNFVENFVMSCSLVNKEVNYSNIKKCLDDLLKVRFEQKGNAPQTSFQSMVPEVNLKRSFNSVKPQKPKAKVSTPKFNQKVVSQNNNGNLKCFRCGASTHLANLCPHKGKTCNVCGGPHLRLMCKKQTAQLATVGEFAFLAENENYIDLDQVNATPIYTGEEEPIEYADFPDFDLDEKIPSAKRLKELIEDDETELVDYDEEPEYC